MTPLCIYHGNCADGFGAAWAVRKALGDIDFHAGIYGEAPPDVTGREVIMVDFSYKRPVLEQMAKAAASILVLDHHLTAMTDLKDFQMPSHCLPCRGIKPWRPSSGINALFDMNRSGAGLTWDYFFPDKQRPDLLNHIYTLTSDAGNLMAEGEPFAACYWDTPAGRVFSLRSRPEGLDVSEIAKAYGGGGHKNASGFQRPRGWEGDE